MLIVVHDELGLGVEWPTRSPNKVGWRCGVENSIQNEWGWGWSWGVEIREKAVIPAVGLHQTIPMCPSRCCTAHPLVSPDYFCFRGRGEDAASWAQSMVANEPQLTLLRDILEFLSLSLLINWLIAVLYRSLFCY